MKPTTTGQFVRQPGGYSAFIPNPLPPADLALGPKIQSLQSRADRAVGRLDMIAEVVPAIELFVLMYERREAVLSSQIEGTYASLMDVLEFEAQSAQAGTEEAVQEIVNYVSAVRYGLDRLQTLPLSLRLLKEIHRILMKGVRGGEPHKTPGEFRRSQNWIGGGSPATARFVPTPANRLMEALAPLEEFLHESDSDLPVLIKIGLIHAQFETIHPFLDGNGRMGRLLVTLWLVDRGILRFPLLYLALFFKQNREEYMNRLQTIREEGSWTPWLEFFLDGVAQVANEATDQARAIVELRERHRGLIARKLGRRTSSGLALLDYLFGQPLVESRTVEQALKLSQPSTSAMINSFVKLGILRELTGRKRNRKFAYSEYLDLFPDWESRD